ncbi:MAG: DNA repair protein RecN [Anaerolineae bacterium]|jgi:DNA repair protein RecN (Recombination protein N)|nr:DNA repair protein RecN [Anaerolineae bacterium]
MLEELRIQNFAIIERLELLFDRGFNVITGETGAGKSIIIDALELLLGSKVDTSLVRAGEDRAVVEGVFALTERDRRVLLPVLEREGLIEADEPPPADLTLMREVRRSGRSTARINGVAVSAEVMREVGETLVDIHGQNAHMSLFRPRAHIELLDKFGDALLLRAALGRLVDIVTGVRAQIKALLHDKEELQRRAERLRYAVDEIRMADLKPADETDLLSERNRLANSEQIATLAGEMNGLLNGDEREGILPAVNALMQVASLMGRLAKIDATLAEDYALAEELSSGAQDLALTISRYADKVEYNPQRLDALEERLELIKTLKRRYKCDSIEELLHHADRAAAELDSLENSEERLHDLRAEEEKLLRQIGDVAGRLHTLRDNAGKLLAKRIVRELKDLRMERTEFEVLLELTPDAAHGCYMGEGRFAFDATGVDRVEFMMSANPGEPLRPLARVASGGEAARIMLAIKRVLAGADETPLLIFDEIDQGIGGRIGAVVGEKLWSLTGGHQVMVVTHMAQLAGFADMHYHVQKLVEGERTATRVTPLREDPERVRELAAMLGAEGEATIESARGLLEAARVRKQELRLPRQENLL